MYYPRQFISSRPQWTIAARNQTEQDRKQLVNIFRWVCDAANSMRPFIPVGPDEIEYIEGPLRHIRRGKVCSRLMRGSRCILETVCADQNRPNEQTHVGIRLLRFVGYLGDAVDMHGPFTVSLPKAISILFDMIDLDARRGLRTFRREGERTFLTTTLLGREALGLDLAIELENVPSDEGDVGEFGYSRLRDWTDGG